MCWRLVSPVWICDDVHLQDFLTHRYRPKIPEPAPSLSRYGAPIGGIPVSPAIKISMIRHMRPMCCGLSMKINMCETPYGSQRSWTHAFVSTCVVVKNPNSPNWCSMADDSITRGGIGVLGFPFYLWSHFKLDNSVDEKVDLNCVLIATYFTLHFIYLLFISQMFSNLSIQLPTHIVQIRFSFAKLNKTKQSYKCTTLLLIVN